VFRLTLELQYIIVLGIEARNRRGGLTLVRGAERSYGGTITVDGPARRIVAHY
jgi:hypothetical protein